MLRAIDTDGNQQGLLDGPQPELNEEQRQHHPTHRQNEASMRAASAWLDRHPEYRADLVDAA